MSAYEVPPYKEVAVPDGGRWLIVYHDGDEESEVHRDGRHRLGPTSGTWQIASAATRPPSIPEAVEIDG